MLLKIISIYIISGIWLTTFLPGSPVIFAYEAEEEITVLLTGYGYSVVPAEAPEYLEEVSGGWSTIISETGEVGSCSLPGEPGLPGRNYLIAIPPGAIVTDVSLNFPGEHPILLSGSLLLPVAPTCHLDRSRAEAMMEHWENTRKEAYSGGRVFGETLYLGQNSWRGKNLITILYQPFIYQAGELTYRPEAEIRIAYRFPEPDDPAWEEVARLAGDDILDDIIGKAVINFEEAREKWYNTDPGQDPPIADLEPELKKYDYVILVDDDKQGSLTASLSDFKAWKEKCGHSVIFVEVDEINDKKSCHYSPMGRGASIWSFLRDMHPEKKWGIRYLLLAGLQEEFGSPKMFANTEHWYGLEMRTDHFFARLSGGKTAQEAWDGNGDGFWGEFYQDGGIFLMLPDILVGRLPFNDASSLKKATDAIIAYEKSAHLPSYTPSIRYDALLSGGLTDLPAKPNYYYNTDSAYPLRWIEKLAFKNYPLVDSLYETESLAATNYSTPFFNPAYSSARPLADTKKKNVNLYWKKFEPRHVILKGHGCPWSMAVHSWEKDDNNDGWPDPSECNYNKDIFSTLTNVEVSTKNSAVVQLWGCDTLCLAAEWGVTKNYFLKTLNTKGKIRGCYKFLKKNNGSMLLESGTAAAVIGTGGLIYSTYDWRDYNCFLNGNSSQGSAVVYNLHLIPEYPYQTTELGSAHYLAKLWIGLLYFHPSQASTLSEPYTLQLYGDPAMTVH